MPNRRVRTITLEDHGQDFLEWDVDQRGVVIACRPFQAWMWVGTKILNRAIKPGATLRIRLKGKPNTTTLNYPVEAVT